MPGGNTDSCSACWSEMVSGDAADGEQRSSQWDAAPRCLLYSTAPPLTFPITNLILDIVHF